MPLVVSLGLTLIGLVFAGLGFWGLAAGYRAVRSAERASGSVVGQQEESDNAYDGTPQTWTRLRVRLDRPDGEELVTRFRGGRQSALPVGSPVTILLGRGGPEILSFMHQAGAPGLFLAVGGALLAFGLAALAGIALLAAVGAGLAAGLLLGALVFLAGPPLFRRLAAAP